MRAERGVALGRQAHHLRDAVLVHGGHARHGIGREILRRSLQARDLADVLAIERGELVARDDHVVGDFGVDVLERIARLDRGGGLVGAEIDQAAGNACP